MTHPHIGMVQTSIVLVACASKLRSAYDLPNTNNPPISELYPPNSAFTSLAPRNNADIARFNFRPYQMGMWDVSTLIYDSDTK